MLFLKIAQNVIILMKIQLYRHVQQLYSLFPSTEEKFVQIVIAITGAR